MFIPHSYWTPQFRNFAIPPIWKKFRTWFFEMLFSKSLIKCEKFISCLMQYSKKYWRWPESYVLILHSYWTPQFQSFAIPPIWKKFRTWIFQMFYNKNLIKYEKFISCLMQYSKKYWKWPETYVLILHS